MLKIALYKVVYTSSLDRIENFYLGYVINEFIEQENKIPPTRNISKLDKKIPNNIKIVQVLVFFIDNLYIMTKFFWLWWN